MTTFDLRITTTASEKDLVNIFRYFSIPTETTSQNRKKMPYKLR